VLACWFAVVREQGQFGDSSGEGVPKRGVQRG